MDRDDAESATTLLAACSGLGVTEVKIKVGKVMVRAKFSAPLGRLVEPAPAPSPPPPLGMLLRICDGPPTRPSDRDLVSHCPRCFNMRLDRSAPPASGPADDETEEEADEGEDEPEETPDERRERERKARLVPDGVDPDVLFGGKSK